MRYTINLSATTQYLYSKLHDSVLNHSYFKQDKNE